MERDGIVRRVGVRPGTTRPAQIFELTPEVEQLLSRAYVPLLTHLVSVFGREVADDRLQALLRDAGRDLARELLGNRPLAGTLESRVETASRMLNDALGAITNVEVNGRYVIRGAGCPLSALTGKYPWVCVAIESLVSEVVGSTAHECCDREGRPRCCFEIPRDSSIAT